MKNKTPCVPLSPAWLISIEQPHISNGLLITNPLKYSPPAHPTLTLCGLLRSETLAALVSLSPGSHCGLIVYATLLAVKSSHWKHWLSNSVLSSSGPNVASAQTVAKHCLPPSWQTLWDLRQPWLDKHCSCLLLQLWLRNPATLGWNVKYCSTFSGHFWHAGMLVVCSLFCAYSCSEVQMKFTLEGAKMRLKQH